METEKLAELALRIGYVSLISGTITAGVVWAMTQIKVLINWQKKTMNKAINELFQKQFIPEMEKTYMRIDSCMGQHKVTDLILNTIRQDLSENSKKLDTLLEHILKSKL